MRLSTYLCVTARPTFILPAPFVDGSKATTVSAPPQMAAIAYLALAVTAGAFVAWYAALARLGVERAGLFGGLPAGKMQPLTIIASVRGRRGLGS